MTAPYYTLFTDIGVAKLANATATDTPLNITAMGVGDANGVIPTPDPSQTSLINECRRAPLNSLSVDPNNANQIVAEQVLPDDIGGWWIRELGLYDDDGDLIAVGNCPPSYKPLLEEGAAREQVIRIILIVSSDDAVTLKIDPAVVLATREYVDDSIEAHAKSRNHPDGTTTEKGFVQLSSATDSDDETKAATPKAVKAVKASADASVKTINTTHKPDENGNVKLGNAADADIVTSMTETTSGRVPVVGWQGLGGNENIKMGTVSQFLAYNTSTDEVPANGAGWQAAYAPTRRAQLMMTTSGELHSRFSLSEEVLDKTTPWATHYTTLNKPTAADTGALPVTGGSMTGQILLPATGHGAWAGQNDVGAPLYQLIDSAGTSEYWPIFKQKYVEGDSTWSGGVLISEGNLHIHYLNGAGTTANFSFRTDGQFIPQNYANFDARYGQKNTASLAAGGGWWQDASTGLIIQMGIVNRTGPSTSVAFPKAFPNFCTGVLLTLNMYIGSLKDSDANIRVLSHSNTSFDYGGAGDPEKTALWVAFGK